MIKITVYQNAKNEYVGFLTEGHAGYAPAGEDIVCAAASMLVINTVNSIEAFTQDEASVTADDESGKIDYRFFTFSIEGSGITVFRHGSGTSEYGRR